MINMLRDYPYFWSLLLFGVPIYLTVVLLFRSQRKTVLLSSVLAAPQCLIGMLMVPEYWDPNRVFVFGIGPEDVLFMFIVGGMAWAGNVWIVRRTITYRTTARRAASRFFLLSLFFGGCYLLVKDAEISKMYVTFVMCGILVAVLLIRDPGLSTAAAAGASIFVLLYTSLFLLCDFVWPGFVSQWTWANLSGLRFGPVPLEEIVWAGLYSPAWGLTIAFILDARLPGRGGPQQS